jgi:hypothetical protein
MSWCVHNTSRMFGSLGLRIFKRTLRGYGRFLTMPVVARAGRTKLVYRTAIVGVVLGLMGPSSTIARTAKVGPVSACFHGKIRRFTAQAHPSQCVIAGYRGKKFVQVPVKGVNWGHWGAKRTFGAYGVDKRDGRAVRIIAYHPIHCNRGGAWYSKVNVVLSWAWDRIRTSSPDLQQSVCGWLSHLSSADDNDVPGYLKNSGRELEQDPGAEK